MHQEVTIGPWLEGLDIWHKTDHRVFQPDGGRLLVAENVFLDDEGIAEGRPGLTKYVTGTTGTGAFSGAGLLLMQDGTTIKKVTGSETTTNLVTGLGGSRVEYHANLGNVFWTDGTESGLITGAGATNWGLTRCPAPTVGSTAGSLEAGIYQVGATFVDVNGVEHAASKPATITLASAGAITANIGTLDSDATHVNFYATRVNQPSGGLFFVKQVAVGSLPTTITNVKVESGLHSVLKNVDLDPPPAGSYIFSYRSIIFVCVGNFVTHSIGRNQHLFDFEVNTFGFNNTALCGAGLENGLYVLTNDGAFWIDGEPGKWNTRQVDSRTYAKGGLVIPGYYVPKLQYSGMVALFVSEDGLVAGLSEGQIRPLTFDQLPLTVSGLRAFISIHGLADSRQIIFSLG